MTRKFKIGDRCRIIKNALAPECVGDIVEVVGYCENSDKLYYIQPITGNEDGFFDNIKCYATEGAMELVGQLVIEYKIWI